MRTLASALGPHAGRIAGQPRLYVDANVPAGLVVFMRARLRWDVLFVIEHDDLRRARDAEHFRLAHDLRRTLITFDRDFLDDRRFPPIESGGVIVLAAPEERGYLTLLTRIDRDVFGSERERERERNGERFERPERSERSERSEGLPLSGRKLHLHIDWTGGDTMQP